MSTIYPIFPLSISGMNRLRLVLLQILEKIFWSSLQDKLEALVPENGQPKRMPGTEAAFLKRMQYFGSTCGGRMEVPLCNYRSDRADRIFKTTALWIKASMQQHHEGSMELERAVIQFHSYDSELSALVDDLPVSLALPFLSLLPLLHLVFQSIFITLHILQ